MTLCVAWRFEQSVALATDSMVGTSKNHALDIAPKLFPIPTFVRGPVDATSQTVDGVYKHTLALAYATGELYRAAIFKEIFAGVCQHLQYIGNPQTMSFERFSELAKRIYELVMVKACEGSEISSLPDVLLAGWCGEQQKVRVFKLADPESEALSPVVTECLVSSHHFAYTCIGSGADAMARLVEQHEKTHQSIHVNMLRWFQRLIDSRMVESVGGPLQFGDFQQGNFAIRGLIYPPSRQGEDARFMCYNIDIEKLRHPTEPHSLQVTGNFALPFF